MDTESEITFEVIEALQVLRKGSAYVYELTNAFKVLDSIGVFAAIDEAEQDIESAPERITQTTSGPTWDDELFKKED